jgi:anti-anti-sigma factor
VSGGPERCSFTLRREAHLWRLAGEVDLASAPALATGLAETAQAPWVLDLARLEFCDLAGMRAIAMTAAAAGLELQLRGASESFRRYWRLARLHDLAPDVRLVA